MSALRHELNDAARAVPALRDQLAAERLADPADQAVDHGVVGGAIDVGERNAAPRRGQAAELPIPDMPRDDEAGLAVVAHPQAMLEADDLDAAPGHGRWGHVGRAPARARGWEAGYVWVAAGQKK